MTRLFPTHQLRNLVLEAQLTRDEQDRHDMLERLQCLVKPLEVEDTLWANLNAFWTSILTCQTGEQAWTEKLSDLSGFPFISVERLLSKLSTLVGMDETAITTWRDVDRIKDITRQASELISLNFWLEPPEGWICLAHQVSYKDYELMWYKEVVKSMPRAKNLVSWFQIHFTQSGLCQWRCQIQWPGYVKKRPQEIFLAGETNDPMTARQDMEKQIKENLDLVAMLAQELLLWIPLIIHQDLVEAFIWVLIVQTNRFLEKRLLSSQNLTETTIGTL